MIKFKKVFSIKVVSVIVAATFFLGSIAFGIELSNKAHIRVSSMEDNGRNFSALDRNIDFYVSIVNGREKKTMP